ncbi:hypothetical protein J2X69_001305 [Algoriphagus sp. 4150]|uniref:hypothetical protein n=1 Tax=Algoriphagus sp. 4150 TaxID=2817756 RepID=UPI002859B6AC|nr:hypothetical protein [Algoriphagus sp. 4150]MDR7128970.1 hypothetical protein [Algoriphagus sp. 4150]
MRLIIWFVSLLLTRQEAMLHLSMVSSVKQFRHIEKENIAYLKVGDQIVFDNVRMENATFSVYPNQLMFTIMDDEGQHVSLTFAGRDIAQRKPDTLSFNQPGLFHGFSEAGDVFFIGFGKFDSDREPGQVKYDMSFPQNIMEGQLQVIIWTSEEFVFEFNGKLGKEKEVDQPELWVPFSGKVSAKNYLQFEM